MIFIALGMTGSVVEKDDYTVLISRLKFNLFFCAILITLPSWAIESEFDRWKHKHQTAFSDFQTSEDKAFVRFLEAEWEAFSVFRGDSRDLVPKPATVPGVRETVSSFQSLQSSFSPHSKKASMPLSGFFGHTFRPVELPVRHLRDISVPTNSKLAGVWSDLSAVDHTEVITRLQQQRKELELGDWGLILFTQKQLQYQIDDTNQRLAYAWFLLNRLGFDVRIGYTSSSVFLLVPAKNQVYGRKFASLGNKKYYMYPEPVAGKIFSYNGKSQPSLVDFDFTLHQLIKTTHLRETLAVKLAFSPTESLALDFGYDLGLSEFLATYPQIDLKWYFQVEPGNPTAESLLQQLRPLVEGLSERAAVNLLLHFTQNLFYYQTDNQQFGKEKYLLVEESLHYGINDCEDRSIFLAWLVKTLLHLDVVVLDYPGHLALAVSTRASPNDAIVSYQGKRYVIADPTYIGSDLGMSMPAMAKFSPNVIPVKYASKRTLYKPAFSD